MSTITARQNRASGCEGPGDVESVYQMGEKYRTGATGTTDNEQAMLCYHLAAQQGHAGAQYTLGEALWYGRLGAARNEPEAIEWLQRAAEQDHVPAQVRLGVCYQAGGEVVPKDEALALHWLRRAAVQGGHAGSQYWVGTQYARERQTSVAKAKLAFHFFAKAAEQGHAGAQCELGRAFEEGYGVATGKDLVQAVDWYREAADQGNTEAMFRLGRLQINRLRAGALPTEVDDGQLVEATTALMKAAEKDHVEAQFMLALILAQDKQYESAAEWLVKASAKGHADAQYHLARALFDGRGLAVNEQLAFGWLQHAATEGHAKAQFELGTTLLRGEHGQTADPATGVDWLRKAAEQGHAGARCELAEALWEGNGVQKDDWQVVYWFQKVADAAGEDAHYVPAALFGLGQAYEAGRGVAQSMDEAVAYFRHAAEEGGHAGAQFRLGVLHLAGRGVEKDAVAAADWFTLAADQGHADAQLHLGVLCANGRGVPKDDAAAASWLTKAAEQGVAKAQFAVAVMYLEGRGVPRNEERGLHWLERAAEQGLPEAGARIRSLTHPSYH